MRSMRSPDMKRIGITSRRHLQLVVLTYEIPLSANLKTLLFWYSFFHSHVFDTNIQIVTIEPDTAILAVDLRKNRCSFKPVGLVFVVGLAKLVTCRPRQRGTLPPRFFV